MYHNKAKHYYGFYVPVDQMISKQYWVSVGPGSVGPRKPKTEHHCFKMPPTHPTADSQGPQYGSKPTLTGAGVSGPRISPSDVFSPWHKSRERNYQCPLGALIIPLPHVFPPTYVGFGISYILGNLIKAKITWIPSLTDSEEM